MEILGNLDRSKIGVIGGVWKSKKLGAVFLWCFACLWGARLLFDACRYWEAVGALGCGSLAVAAYLLAQGKADSGS